MARQQLTAETHEHFRKANILHGYASESLHTARDHALEVGEYLLAAKLTVPPGGWESTCKRLFDGSLRTAQSYMQFAKHMEALPKAQKSALLFLEGSIDGAAKAAKAAAKPKPPKPKPAEPTPEPDDPIDVDSKPVDDEPEEDVEEAPDYGKCPNCAGAKWTEDDSGVTCAKCQHPHGECTGGPDEDRVKTQVQKTRKTAEALMRAFDDLHTMKAKPEHKEAIRLCKVLLGIAKGWK